VKKLWIAFIIIAALGSFYPFNFQFVQLDGAMLRSLLQSCCTKSGRGDILGNIILFLPFGFTGMFAVRPDTPSGWRLLYVCLIALVFGTALQLVQIYLPSRDESLQDVLWNLIGTVAGAALALLANRYRQFSDDAPLDADIVPLVLIATWLTYRLMPFVPSIDYQLIKDSVKPLFDPTFTIGNILPDFAAWLVIGYLLRAMHPGGRLDRFLPILILAVFVLEILIVDNKLHASDVVAAVLALTTWPLVQRVAKREEAPLAALLLLNVTVSGLSPFTFSANSSTFNWLPFHGFLSGSMYLNALSAAEKVFIFGSLVYLLRRLSLGYVGSIGLVFIIVFVVELAQTRLPGHTPEITDPLLVLFAALALIMLSEHSSRAQVSRLGPRKLHKNVTRHPGPNNRHWVTHTINLREEQLHFLELMAKEMGASVSSVARRIVANSIENSDSEGLASGTVAANYSIIETQRIRGNQRASNAPVNWVRLAINLRRQQFEWLSRASHDLDISVSRVIRHIIMQFIEELDDKSV
jgi:VanZ family protein